ncbi:YhaN family protein [Cereibacter sediminicola]|uniref:YhaN family protein n=1 Tax=Cereibacter sediminicola TaxID=2584941 RepID=UPI0011A68D2D|nr:YhaN family protein [Cereibacter sediminicola]
MRLDRLDLTRYGRFTDKRLDFAAPAPGGPDLHVVFGPNEAGKSTLFSAWLDLLFGIPLRSRYDFLHRGPTMQIGAQLSHAGGRLDLRRLKRNNASLLDGHDAVLPETVVQSLLGGLSREGYSAMFSLDDDTLEKGGDSILANRGDLGEMLFSASAGLSDLAPRLESVRAELDGFHRTGKRSGWLCDARRQLADLDARRRKTEVTAGALQRLTREAAAAEAAWREARAREDALQVELLHLQDLAAAVPLRSQRAGLALRLAPIRHLPDADPALRERVEAIERDRLTLEARISDRGLRLEALDARVAALATDPAVLGQSEAIDAAEALRPEHEAALKDLPRRRQEADEALARLKALQFELGRPEGAAGDLVLPAATLGRMRALLAERSGLAAAASAAAAERRKAADHLARERDRLGDPSPDEDEAMLSPLLARLRAQDPADVRLRALRDRDQARERLGAAMARLAPWSGDGENLAALAVPSPAQIAGWETGLEAARQEAADAAREAEAVGADLDRVRSDRVRRVSAGTAVGATLADAAAARSRRESLWAAHLVALDADSAQRFEQAMREDDRLSSLLAEAMAEARREALDQADEDRLSERFSAARTRQHSAAAASADIQGAVAETCARLALGHTSLADLKAWLELRQVALEALAACREAEAGLRRADEAVATAAQALAAALGQSEGTYEPLLALAAARNEAAERRREARRHLAALLSDLREREQADQEAAEGLARWQREWVDASRGTILADNPDTSPELGRMLDLLDELGATGRTLAGLEDRISKMEANRDRFRRARAEVLAGLDLDEATAWPEVLARLRRAQDALRDRHQLATQIADERRQDAEDRRALAARQQEAAALGASLGWEEGSLSDHVAACLEATTLRRELAALDAALAGRPCPAEGDDPDTLRQRIETLKADQQLLRARTETCLAAHLEAARQIEAVGGDDALARLAFERENLLLEIRDRAREHLAARFGLIAVEAGLRRYRDQHRSAMLARAAAAFRLLSRGAYSGLAAQPDGAQEVLVALCADGGTKLATDLSKGTRFQLYLALRIAGYHELAQSRPAVPFIADDIMETFDDDRSAAAFSLLAEMSQVGQVIYLTHHRHLCEIARDACPGANIIDLQQA